MWANVMCNAAESGTRVVTHGPWIYLDEQACDGGSGSGSANAVADSSSNGPSCMACYFPRAEMVCPEDHVTAISNKTSHTLLYNHNGLAGLGCASIQKQYTPGAIRAAATEFLFGK